MGVVAPETVVSWNEHSGPLVTRAHGHDVIGCAVCGFKHVVPLPEPGDLERAYREQYYAEEKPTFIVHAGEDKEWSELFHRDRLDIFESRLPRERRRLLDIGSGPGFFLKSARDRGWKTLGIEPSRQAGAYARDTHGLSIVEGFFNAETAPTLGVFDVVHLNNVVEHLPNPREVLGLARDLLAPGGLICLNVPNDFSPLQIAAHGSLGTGEWWVAPPHHLNYFDFDSLVRLVERHGFAVEERLTSFPMEMFLLMGFDYTKDPALGRACHTQRKRFDMALENAGLRDVRRAFYRALAATGLGREAVIIAVKQ